MKNKFYIEWDISFKCNFIVYFLTFSLCFISTKPWFERHQAHMFTDVFFVATLLGGFLIILTLIPFKLWIPLKVFFSLMVSSSISINLLYLINDNYTKINGLKIDKFFLSFLIMPIYLKLHIITPIMFAIYILYFNIKTKRLLT